MSANKSDLLVSIGFAGNRSAVVMLVLTSLITILAFTVGPSVSAAFGVCGERANPNRLLAFRRFRQLTIGVDANRQRHRQMPGNFSGYRKNIAISNSDPSVLSHK
jgi:hypothetical protein